MPVSFFSGPQGLRKFGGSFARNQIPRPGDLLQIPFAGRAVIRFAGYVARINGHRKSFGYGAIPRKMRQFYRESAGPFRVKAVADCESQNTAAFRYEAAR